MASRRIYGGSGTLPVNSAKVSKFCSLVIIASPPSKISEIVIFVLPTDNCSSLWIAPRYITRRLYGSLPACSSSNSSSRGWPLALTANRRAFITLVSFRITKSPGSMNSCRS